MVRRDSRRMGCLPANGFVASQRLSPRGVRRRTLPEESLEQPSPLAPQAVLDRLASALGGGAGAVLGGAGPAQKRVARRVLELLPLLGDRLGNVAPESRLHR